MRMSELPGRKVVLCTPSQDKSEEKGAAWNNIVTNDGYKFSGEIGRRAKEQEERESVIGQKLHISMSPGSRLCPTGMVE